MTETQDFVSSKNPFYNGGTIHHLPPRNPEILTTCGLRGNDPGVNWDTDPEYVTCSECLNKLNRQKQHTA